MSAFIKKIIKFLIPFYFSYAKCASSRIHNMSYIKFLKYKVGLSKLYYPVAKTFMIANPRSVFVGINSTVARPGGYIQGAGKVYIGNYVVFAPNTGILSANHNLYFQDKYDIAPIIIGDYCWLGMNSIVTAGVTLGTRTIVAAGAVVTRSFPDGFCVLAGVPAKPVKYLDKNKFIPWHYENEFYGFISKDAFDRKRKKYIDL